MPQILLLKDLGIPMQSVCNMAAIAHEILLVPPQQAKTVVEYCKKRGVEGVHGRSPGRAPIHAYQARAW